MGGKSGSPPTPPDPNQVSQAQTQASIDAARAQQGLNAVDQNNPFGNVVWGIDPNTGRLTQNTSLNQASQHTLNNQQQGQSQMSDFAMQQLPGLYDYLQSHPFDVNSGPGLTANVQGGQIPTSFGGYGSPQYSMQNNAGDYQTGMNIPHMGDMPQVSGGQAFHFNTKNMPDLNQDYGKQFEEAQQSVLTAQMPVLDRLQQHQQEQLNAQLAGQGFTGGGQEGYSRAQQDLRQSQGEAYNQLAAQAYQQGLGTQHELFGENLGSRQQLFGEQATQAQNQMQAQQLSEMASAANAQNMLAKNQQEFGQNYAAGQFHNQALGQQFGQNLAAGQFGNQAQNQAYQQALGQGMFGMAGQQQGFSQGMQNAQLGNQANQQSIQNQMLQRQYPLQEISQMFGGQIQMPQFGSVPQAGVQAPNYGQYVYNTAGLNQDAHNAQVGGNNANMSGLFGLAGSIPWGSMFGGGG